MNTTENAKTAKIQNLNDHLRMTMGVGGKIMLTQGILLLPIEDQNTVFDVIANFSDFDENNDPYGEHDFGAITHNSKRIFWKIDYYDKEMVFGSEDPADENQTTRVLTIMLASEY